MLLIPGVVAIPENPHTGFICPDLRLEETNREFVQHLFLRAIPCPGIRLGTPDEAYARWRHRYYRGDRHRVYFFPHGECNARSSDDEAVSACEEYAKFFYHNGTQAACVYLQDGLGPEIIFNGLDADGLELLQRSISGQTTKYHRDAKANALSVGHDFSLQNWRYVLRLGAHHFDDDTAKLWDYVVRLFCDRQVPLYFSREIPRDEQEAISVMVRQLGWPVHFASAA
ncbi:MAG: hypothetical protein WC107_05345 [Patescibacteria group bacterium]